MEILSTGEKIKRARIYKGITLKELCGDKISISKMSCIENGKIKADKETLKFISDKLQVNYNYLVQDVYEQIKENLNTIRSKEFSMEELENIINYNLENTYNNGFNDLALELLHILFTLYIEKNKTENIQVLMSKYYDLHKSTKKVEDVMIYYYDMAMFFMKTKEYHEAISYFSRIRELFKENELSNKSKYIYVCFYEGLCYKKINLIEKAYECLKSILNDVEELSSDEDKGNFYHEFAILNILLYNSEASKYLSIALQYKKGSKSDLARFNGKNAESYFEVNEIKSAMELMEECIKIYPREDKKGCGEFLIKCISTLYKNKQYDKAFEYTDEALDIAIDIDEIYLIEKAYYFKGMIYQKRSQFRQSEMYMNLATDFLLRFANKEEKYKRYNEMAELYYSLGEYKESVKYFTLAINIEKSYKI